MTATTEIRFESPDNLYLDPKNPRLGRTRIAQQLSQDQLLQIMQEWSLEELAVSFLESGFWPHEALIAVREQLDGESRLVVVEGNRRLAALKLLLLAHSGKPATSRWRSLVESYPSAAFDALDQIPYIFKASRVDISAFLGFRHVTGIKEWDPAEKAQFIAYLIENEHLTYEQVRRRIGSRTPTVRQNYIAYQLLLQIEDHVEEVNVTRLQNRFSVLYLSLRTRGVRHYLGVNTEADPPDAKIPVQEDKLQALSNYSKWMFGTTKQDPLVADSRDIDEFGHILESEAALEYLERTTEPSFAVASRLAGVAESVVAGHVERAADEAEEALKVAHQHKTSRRLQIAVRRLALDALQLLELFPDTRSEVFAEKD